MVNLSLRPVCLFVITHCALFYYEVMFSILLLQMLVTAGCQFCFRLVGLKLFLRHLHRKRQSRQPHPMTKSTVLNVQHPMYFHAHRKAASRSSAMEHHLSLEACSMSPERHTLIDLAKQQYATLLSEGIALLPSLQFSSSVSNSNQGQSLKEGWALKKTKRPYRFRRKAESLPGG